MSSSSSVSLSVNDIWNSLNDIEVKNIEEVKRKKATLINSTSNNKIKKKKNSDSNLDLMMHDLLLGQLSELPKLTGEKNEFKKKICSSSSSFVGVSMNILENDTNTIKKKHNNIDNDHDISNNERLLLTAADMIAKIGRDISCIEGSNDINIKKNSFIHLEKSLFVDNTMSEEDYNEVFSDICKPIFKKFADPSGKCRELSMKLTKMFFQNATDFVPILGYFIPALMQRIPPEIAFDEEMKVFISDFESHDAYKRGKAVDRQDKGGIQGMNNHTVIETSEETRLLACSALYNLIKRVIDIGAASVLHPYFHEIILFLQFQLKDPCPDLKLEACGALELLALHEEFVPGMKYFAVGLVRAILPVLRHRHAKVRVAALSALRGCMIVPDRAKCRGAGTEAMPDLVGFREENVLQVAAFYKSDVQINYLAELAIDKSVLVREKLVSMLITFLTELPDRYDHQTRLLPYLLDLLTDDADSVSQQAMECLKTCGQQYEKEHPEDVIEKRQFGVDGDQRINLDKPYPKPFTERPRIGLRLYVRGNTKRYLIAIVNELTSWQSKVRVKSAQLLKIIFFLCEEHLTMEAHVMLPSLIKALGFAKEDKDDELHNLLLEVYELYGRYTLPDTYIHYILPRLRGDPHVTAFGPDSNTRITVLEFLNALLSGTKPSLLPLHFEELVNTLTDPFVIDPESKSVPSAALDVIVTIVNSMQGRGKAAIEGHFLTSGRLTTLKTVCRRVFQVLVVHLFNPLLHTRAVKGLQQLSFLDTDPEGSIQELFTQHGNLIIHAIMKDYDLESWSVHQSDHILLNALIECPFNVIYNNTKLFEETITFLCHQITASASIGFTNQEVTFLEKMAQMLISAILPFQYISYPKRNVGFDGLFHGDDESLWPGITHSGGASSDDILSLLQRLLDPIFSSFVFDNRWSKISLQLSRINLLSVLFGSKYFDTDSNFDIINKEVLLKVSSRLSEVVVSPAIHPSSTFNHRKSAIELQQQMFHILSRNSGILEANGKLKSFKMQSMIDSPLIRKIKAVAQKGIDIVLSAIDDPNDDIRLKAVEAMTIALPLISRDEYDENGLLNESINTFSIIVISLLNEAQKNYNEMFSIHLDLLLGQIAVLDAPLFEATLRKVLSKPNMKNRAFDDPAIIACSQLIDHCDILMKFDK